MKYLSCLFLLTIILISCQKKPGETEANRLRSENFRLRQENDSLKRTQRASAPGTDTIALMDEVRKTVPPENLTGVHAISLQWINKEFHGSVTIAPDQSGWYSVSGQQLDPENDRRYLKINGRIRRISPKVLLFEGTIETRAPGVNQGRPCIRKGKNTFKATGSAPYWRMQDVINCEGGNTADYIDIYF
ncbi:MAG TPA: hypothetical protein VGE15_04270 [Sphingobacteriaceae bacterium]